MAREYRTIIIWSFGVFANSFVSCLFADDAARNPLVAYDDPNIQNEKQCRRTAWHRDLPINCNVIHEFDILTRFSSGDTKFLGAGAYRQVYQSKLPEGKFVLKEFIWDAQYGLDDYEFMRMDAIVAERLSSNDRIVDIYSFCALGMINEAMPFGDAESLAVPSGNGRSESYAGIDDNAELQVFNNLSGTKKLQYALDMAEAVLLLHSYPDGVIVHDGKKSSAVPTCFFLLSRLTVPQNFSISLASQIFNCLSSSWRKTAC